MFSRANTDSSNCLFVTYTAPAVCISTAFSRWYIVHYLVQVSGIWLVYIMAHWSVWDMFWSQHYLVWIIILLWEIISKTLNTFSTRVHFCKLNAIDHSLAKSLGAVSVKSVVGNERYTAVQSQKIVSAHFTSKQILPFASAERYDMKCFPAFTCQWCPWSPGWLIRPIDPVRSICSTDWSAISQILLHGAGTGLYIPVMRYIRLL